MSESLTGERLDKLPYSCRVKMQAVYPGLKKAERKAAELILASPGLIGEQTIIELSDLSDSSEATWSRLSKKLGFPGFHEMKEAFRRPVGEDCGPEGSAPRFPYENLTPGSTPKEIAVQVFDEAIRSLQDTRNMMDWEQYDAAAQALRGAGRIIACGVGDAYAVAKSLRHKLTRIGVPISVDSDCDAQLIRISQMSRGDVLIAISYSGKTKSVLDLAKYARSCGVTVAAVTNFPNTPLARNADILLLTAAFSYALEEEAISKRIAQMCIIECLYVNLLLAGGDRTRRAGKRSARALARNKLS
jgi:DNA-binding MurR/RpiR family transcriptional regulator